jgi:hypothetical protein
MNMPADSLSGADVKAGITCLALRTEASGADQNTKRHSLFRLCLLRCNEIS